MRGGKDMTDLSGDGVDLPALRIVTLHALACGAVSVAAVLAVGLGTTDQDWTMSIGPMFISVAASLCAVCVITALSPLLSMLVMRRRGLGAYLTHALVPILLVVLIPLGVAIGGPVRDQWETGFELHIRPDPQMPSLAPLAPQITLRRVQAQQLAELPGTDWQRSVGWTTD
jgi:hypothetical protein